MWFSRTPLFGYRNCSTFTYCARGRILPHNLPVRHSRRRWPRSRCKRAVAIPQATTGSLPLPVLSSAAVSPLTARHCFDQDPCLFRSPLEREIIEQTVLGSRSSHGIGKGVARSVDANQTRSLAERLLQIAMSSSVLPASHNCNTPPPPAAHYA